MEKEDKRKISQEAKHELRKAVCRLYFDKKMSIHAAETDSQGL